MRDLSDLEAMARSLEASGDYRVLRRLAARPDLPEGDLDQARTGIFLDLETTGVDTARDEIIELAMVRFRYDAQGQILSIDEAFTGLQEPTKPLPAQITQITGITDAMVAGQTINWAAAAQFIDQAAVIIAHNARFDRRFAERFCDAFVAKPWGCSMSQVDWVGEGFEGTKLSYLAARAGFFYDGHRAEHDCRAALSLLSRPLPVSGAPALRQLLQTARRPTVRIWAEGAPYEMREALKQRGYRWNGENGPSPRAWYVDVEPALYEAEVSFLCEEIYRGQVEPIARRLTAFERFSDRC